jgi:hypothetical protein
LKANFFSWLKSLIETNILSFSSIAKSEFGNPNYSFAPWLMHSVLRKALKDMAGRVLYFNQEWIPHQVRKDKRQKQQDKKQRR